MQRRDSISIALEGKGKHAMQPYGLLAIDGKRRVNPNSMCGDGRKRGGRRDGLGEKTGHMKEGEREKWSY
jgi:hypothetical protein